jgi:hypothetical protein
MPRKKLIVDEVTATCDDGNEKDIKDNESEDSRKSGEDDSDVKADGEWITIPRTLYHLEDKITSMEARDYNYSCKLGFKLNQK